MSKKKKITLKDKYPITEIDIGGIQQTIDMRDMIHRTYNKILTNEWCEFNEVSYDQFVERRKSDFQISEDLYEEIHNIGLNSGMYGRTHMMWNILNDIMIVLGTTPNIAPPSSLKLPVSME